MLTNTGKTKNFNTSNIILLFVRIFQTSLFNLVCLVCSSVLAMKYNGLFFISIAPRDI